MKHLGYQLFFLFIHLILGTWSTVHENTLCVCSKCYSSNENGEGCESRLNALKLFFHEQNQDSLHLICLPCLERTLEQHANDDETLLSCAKCLEQAKYQEGTVYQVPVFHLRCNYYAYQISRLSFGRVSHENEYLYILVAIYAVLRHLVLALVEWIYGQIPDKVLKADLSKWIYDRTPDKVLKAIKKLDKWIFDPISNKVLKAIKKASEKTILQLAFTGGSKELANSQPVEGGKTIKIRINDAKTMLGFIIMFIIHLMATSSSLENFTYLVGSLWVYSLYKYLTNN